MNQFSCIVVLGILYLLENVLVSGVQEAKKNRKITKSESLDDKRKIETLRMEESGIKGHLGAKHHHRSHKKSHHHKKNHHHHEKEMHRHQSRHKKQGDEDKRSRRMEMTETKKGTTQNGYTLKDIKCSKHGDTLQKCESICIDEKMCQVNTYIKRCTCKGVKIGLKDSSYFNSTTGDKITTSGVDSIDDICDSCYERCKTWFKEGKKQSQATKNTGWKKLVHICDESNGKDDLSDRHGIFKSKTKPKTDYYKSKKLKKVRIERAAEDMEDRKKSIEVNVIINKDIGNSTKRKETNTDYSTSNMNDSIESSDIKELDEYTESSEVNDDESQYDNVSKNKKNQEVEELNSSYQSSEDTNGENNLSTEYNDEEDSNEEKSSLDGYSDEEDTNGEKSPSDEYSDEKKSNGDEAPSDEYNNEEDIDAEKFSSDEYNDAKNPNGDKHPSNELNDAKNVDDEKPQSNEFSDDKNVDGDKSPSNEYNDEKDPDGENYPSNEYNDEKDPNALLTSTEDVVKSTQHPIDIDKDSLEGTTPSNKLDNTNSSEVEGRNGSTEDDISGTESEEKEDQDIDSLENMSVNDVSVEKEEDIPESNSSNQTTEMDPSEDDDSGSEDVIVPSENELSDKDEPFDSYENTDVRDIPKDNIKVESRSDEDEDLEKETSEGVDDASYPDDENQDNLDSSTMDENGSNHEGSIHLNSENENVSYEDQKNNMNSSENNSTVSRINQTFYSGNVKDSHELSMEDNSKAEYEGALSNQESKLSSYKQKERKSDDINRQNNEGSSDPEARDDDNHKKTSPKDVTPEIYTDTNNEVDLERQDLTTTENSKLSNTSNLNIVQTSSEHRNVEEGSGYSTKQEDLNLIKSGKRDFEEDVKKNFKWTPPILSTRKCSPRGNETRTCIEECNGDGLTCTTAISLQRCTCSGQYVNLVELRKYDLTYRKIISYLRPLTGQFGEGYISECGNCFKFCDQWPGEKREYIVTTKALSCYDPY